ncbi:probable 2-oxoglutarate-dependent dioxygenase AOP1 isoform X2 [Brassica rapa]|uniref:probable 2-oxoglutarate-dependent dioxygenase AOP1 isoform X2 n=1 Tax=Brassica campestris TaxID=3711 RepID=UPI0004F1638B|nr:probable 2-oxoglutarate-dependent dioxygenase AOP1 isoform X2 [Brassica rapa]XP_048635774.1 probable 2-oxoglutarate-dependent dioxygenase AOP1 isoform X2 [Brassica napus]
MTISSKPQCLPLSLPVIDFSVPNLKPETPQWDSVRAQVRKALEDFGCFEALFDGASVELRKAVFEASQEVFDLPLETKLSAKSEKNRNNGYSGQVSGMPLFEGMGFDDVDNPEVVNKLTHKVWPQGNITFSNTVQSFAEKLIELNVKVRTMLMESFGLEKYVEEHLTSAKNRFHLFKYKGLDDNTEEDVGIDTHIDRHFLTILCQNDVVDGLEIRAKDGEEWFKAKPSQDSSYLVMVLLNGRVHPPLHHVVITGKKDRYVAGLFLRPKEGLIINAPEEIVDDEHPRLYKPFNFEDYFKFTYIDTKKRDLPALKAYCAL